MSPPTTHHAYTPDCLDSPVRHKHEFTPPPAVAQRCNCGHRNFVVNVGGSMSAQVACAKCANQNRTATAWLAGYAQGRHDITAVAP